MRTGNANMAPIAKPCFEKMACGIISAKSTSNAVETMTEMNPMIKH
jgi:hypothetical protein